MPGTTRYVDNLVIVGAKETTYGTDASPAITNYIQVRNAKITTFEGETEKLGIVDSRVGGEQEIQTTQYTKLDFEVMLAGSGTAGTPPPFGFLLRACGMSETIDATVGSEKVIYDYVRSGFESLTLYYYEDGILYKLLGARGREKFNLSPRKTPFIAFSFLGLAVNPADVALPTGIDDTAWKNAIPITATNTPVFTLDGFAASLHEFDIDSNNTVKHLNVVNQEEIIYEGGGAKPGSSLTIAQPLLAEKDFFTLAKNATPVAMNFQHGSTAGAIYEARATQTQIIRPTQTALNGGVAGLQMSLSYLKGGTVQHIFR